MECEKVGLWGRGGTDGRLPQASSLSLRPLCAAESRLTPLNPLLSAPVPFQHRPGSAGENPDVYVYMHIHACWGVSVHICILSYHSVLLELRSVQMNLTTFTSSICIRFECVSPVF